MNRDPTGFTLVELLIVIAIIGIVGSMAVPRVMDSIEQAKYARAISDIKAFYQNSIAHNVTSGSFPSTWSDLGYSDPPRDPWGNKYVLNNHNVISPGARRKDGPVVPINDHIDIFSKGPNGSSNPNIHSVSSRDDVILGADGSFVGKAADF